MKLSEMLLPELEAEIGKTRKVLANVPDGRNDFKSHEKSMPLSRLAGHTAELAGFAGIILTHANVNAGGPDDPRTILRMEGKDKLLADFEALAAKSIEALKNTSDEAFAETFTLSRQGNTIFAMPRYQAYRNAALNHMIHHRAQLGVYLRLMDVAVPSTFGPTADEK